MLWLKQPTVSKFQSTHPARGATELIPVHSYVRRISIHAPRERCDENFGIKFGDSDISIHAPRERCDPARCGRLRFRMISIHAPRERCDHNVVNL